MPCELPKKNCCIIHVTLKQEVGDCKVLVPSIIHSWMIIIMRRHVYMPRCYSNTLAEGSRKAAKVPTLYLMNFLIMRFIINSGWGSSSLASQGSSASWHVVLLHTMRVSCTGLELLASYATWLTIFLTGISSTARLARKKKERRLKLDLAENSGGVTIGVWFNTSCWWCSWE